jgi:hypothetical protein
LERTTKDAIDIPGVAVLLVDGQIDLEDEGVHRIELTHRPEMVSALGARIHNEIAFVVSENLETKATTEIRGLALKRRESPPVAVRGERRDDQEIAHAGRISPTRRTPDRIEITGISWIAFGLFVYRADADHVSHSSAAETDGSLNVRTTSRRRWRLQQLPRLTYCDATRLTVLSVGSMR